MTRELSDEIHAVILSGSVARGDARSTSDIDVLLITRHGDHVRARVVALEEEVDAQHGYSTFLTSLTLAELTHLGAEGSPLLTIGARLRLPLPLGEGWGEGSWGL